MFFSFLRWAMRCFALLALGAALLPAALSTPLVVAGPAVNPLVSDWLYLKSGTTPPSETDCTTQTQGVAALHRRL